jgi:hypothetical protein
VIRWDNGHTFSIHHNQESGIVLETEKGHRIQMDENSAEIRLKTHNGGSKITMFDSGLIIAHAANHIILDTPQVTITGRLQVDRDIHANETIIDDLGNTNHHGH